MIELKNLSKAFKGKPALHGLSLKVERGEIFGLLGHNGAGKSTTFGIMLGQVFADAGEAFIAGISVQRERARALARVGAIFESPAFYDYLSGWKNLEIFTSYSARVPRKEIEEVVEIVGLTERIHDPVRTYSHGMRQRLGLAQALLPAPELVLLDEPTEGLDPEGIHEIRNLIQRLNRERGLTVLFSSHLLSEVEQLCDHVAILNQGRKIFDGRWDSLGGDGTRYRLEVDDWARAAGVVVQTGAKVIEPGLIELPAGRDAAELVAGLVGVGVKVRAVEPLRRNLEQMYLELTQPGAAAVESSTSSSR
ncbi:MAG: type transport system ATP-binding protein [Chthoniobacter sp.]|jgi:ABC-2 type transport system ATP-binding protein|nr:type transport system ATP-binding protein [Chthoniobacter sp.]